jgi:hypothetical protein
VIACEANPNVQAFLDWLQTMYPLPKKFVLLSFNPYLWPKIYTVNILNPTVMPDWEHVLSNATYSKLFTTLICENTGCNLFEQEGLLDRYANATLNLLILDTLLENQWMRILSTAQEKSVNCNFG